MRLQSLRVRDFKRFADFTVDQIPQTSKLVVLTGPNGSGKTSLFEAFNYWMNVAARQDWSYDADYYLRPTEEEGENPSPGRGNPASVTWSKISPTFYGIDRDIRNDREACKKAFYVRSAYRHEADFSTSGLQKLGDIFTDPRRATKLILPESRVSDNYQRMVGVSLERLYDSNQRERTAGQITDELIGEVRNAMGEVFGDLVLEGPGNPLEGGTFRFSKGTVTGFHYKNLSGGEKAAFDLLLDFIVKRKTFDDTIYCIDEPELHMHTRLQAKLLRVMFDLVPENCQLWLATHSIGMAREATALHRANPGQVAFVDFHDQNFDEPVTMQPIQPDSRFWQQMFHTALDDLADLVVPNYVVFCEGKRLGNGGRKPSFDVDIYRIIFSPQFPDVGFIPLGGTNEVERDGKAFALLLSELAPGVKCWKVFDRDDRHDGEIQQLQAGGTQVLQRRDLESYLWDEEILGLLCDLTGHSDKLTELLEEKQQALADGVQQGHPPDDIKAAAGRLYNKCKQALGLTQCGNDVEAFERLTLAPLITPNTRTYAELVETVMMPRAESNP